MKQVLFIHGAGDQGFELDKQLVASLHAALGAGYELRSPKIETDQSLPDFGWVKQIAAHVNRIPAGAVLVAHSLGASMLLKVLSEYPDIKEPVAIFLLATPFWAGDESWKQGLKLNTGFAQQLSAGIQLFFYHCRDDKEVSFEQFLSYKKLLPFARFREFPHGGHQCTGHFGLIARDIQHSGLCIIRRSAGHS